MSPENASAGEVSVLLFGIVGILLLYYLCCFVFYDLSRHLTHFAQMDSISLVIHPQPRLPLRLKWRTLAQRVMQKVCFLSVSPLQRQLRASQL